MSRWKWIRYEGDVLLEVGINDDGTLWNPHGEPEVKVRAAIALAEKRRHENRSAAAKKAAATRRERQEKAIYEAARRIFHDGHRFGPARSCVICGNGLGDADSVERGIGSDCWQKVMRILTANYKAEAAS
jgi:hypothetical protein